MSARLVLRPYQEEAIAAVERALGDGVRRPLIVLPTGTGKTICFATLIARRGGSALVLAHRDELLRQAAEKLAIADPTLALGVGFVAAARDDVNAPVVVASVQTLAHARRLRRLPRHFDTVVVDEAHHASARSYRRILAHLDRSPLILGVTATPQRSDRQQLGDVWEQIVYQRGIAEMIRAGYLADVRGVRVGLDANLDRVAQSGGDFDADALGAALEQASAPRHVLAAHRAHAAGRRTLVFAPTVALAHAMARAFREGGTPAEALDGTTPLQQRHAILARLRDGETQVIANVAVLSEGFDEPSVNCIVMATPTRSQVKYAQCVGRALRTFPGKDDCLVIDVVGVSDQLDLQTLPRLFHLSQQPAPSITVTDALER
jgi:superfamily II DNA or RNA helicase